MLEQYDDWVIGCSIGGKNNNVPIAINAPIPTLIPSNANMTGVEYIIYLTPFALGDNAHM